MLNPSSGVAEKFCPLHPFGNAHYMVCHISFTEVLAWVCTQLAAGRHVAPPCTPSFFARRAQLKSTSPAQRRRRSEPPQEGANICAPCESSCAALPLPGPSFALGLPCADVLKTPPSATGAPSVSRVGGPLKRLIALGEERYKDPPHTRNPARHIPPANMSLPVAKLVTSTLAP